MQRGVLQDLTKGTSQRYWQQINREINGREREGGRGGGGWWEWQGERWGRGRMGNEDKGGRSRAGLKGSDLGVHSVSAIILKCWYLVQTFRLDRSDGLFICSAVVFILKEKAERRPQPWICFSSALQNKHRELHVSPSTHKPLCFGSFALS